MSAYHVRGVTLIELMIGLVIMVLLMLAAMPFGIAWTEGNRQMQVRSELVEGMSQARSIALRNPAGRRSGLAAATLRLRSGVLEVVVPGTASPLWSSTVRSGTTFKLTNRDGFASATAMASSGNAGFDCVSFDPRGLRLPGADGCSDTTLGQDRIAVGLSSQDPLYVEML